MDGLLFIFFFLFGIGAFLYGLNFANRKGTVIIIIAIISLLCSIVFGTNSSEKEQIAAKLKAEVEIFSKPSGVICYDNLYSKRSYTSSHKFAVFPIPPRHPRKGLSPADLAHAHLLITYKECYCFGPQTEKGWEYLETCRKYFSDLDSIYDNFVKIKKERMDLWYL